MESDRSSKLLIEVDTEDRGADTQRRFRYQAAYAAMLALELLDPDSEFMEIFCEHHEDILVRKKNSLFVGIQVKTRELGRDPFKADDAQIIHSIKRFIEQSIQYPDNFSTFVIATNYSFWSERKNSKNLHYLLGLAKAAFTEGETELDSTLARYIPRVTKQLNVDLRNSCTSDIVLSVLTKIRLEHRLPKFDDVESRLVNQIPHYYEADCAGFDDLLRAARMLISKMFEAASLSHVSPRQSYFAILSDPERSEVDAIVEGKRVTDETVHNILNEVLSSEALLRTTDSVSISDLPPDMRTMELKMAKGKISAANIYRAKDHKYSAHALFDSWIYKYGPQRADERYQQLKVIIGNECQEAYDSVFKPDLPFGHDMLQVVRERIRNRHADESASFFGCKYEHLLGVAGILTELCDVWWSESFEISEDV